MPSPSERAFAAFPRGHIRDEVILAHFRAELRTIVNPATGVTFTDDEVQRATAPGTRFYVDADAIDLLGQAQQQRAIHLAEQLDPRRANGRTAADAELTSISRTAPDLPANVTDGPCIIVLGLVTVLPL